MRKPRRPTHRLAAQDPPGSSVLALTRAREDRRLYELDGVGTLRLAGWTSRSATAQAGEGLRWEIRHRGFWQRGIEATDQNGAVVGEYMSRAVGRGGALRWLERRLTLRPDSLWWERYALLEGDRALASIESTRWGRRPVSVTVDTSAATIDPGLLLFATFVVRALADDASAAAGAGAAAAVG